MYLLFDNTGKNIGHCDEMPNLEDLATRGESAVYFDGELNGTAILVGDSIKIIPPQPSLYHEWNEEKWQWVISEESQKAQFAQQKERLVQYLASKTDQLKSQALEGYPQTEIDSFYRQEREARDWKVNQESPIPMLSAIAENRGVPLAILVEKVIEKADLLASQMGNLLGQKQAFEDRLNAVDTIEKLTELKQEIEQWTL